MSHAPNPPPELGEVGRELWGGVLDYAPEHAILDARTLSILATACAQADQNAELESTLKRHGLTVRGAAGQWRLNAAATELRQGGLAPREAARAGVPRPRPAPARARLQR